MQEMIKIEQKDGEQLVSGRELHKKLEITERFNSWFERMLKYGFIENVDFTSVKSFTVVNNGAKKEVDEYILKLDMAKQICMLQRNELGTQFRLYFIECEKQLNNPLGKFKNMDKWDILIMYAEMEKAKEQALLESKQKQEVIDTAARSLMGIECEDSRKNVNMLVKSLVGEYCKFHGIKAGIGNSEAYSTIYRDFCKNNNINYNLVAKGRIKYNKKTGEPLKTKKSIIEVLEEMNQTDNLLKYIKEVKIEDIK